MHKEIIRLPLFLPDPLASHKCHIRKEQRPHYFRRRCLYHSETHPRSTFPVRGGSNLAFEVSSLAIHPEVP